MALTSKLTAIANAIRGKTGTTAKLTLDEMPTEIANIPSGGDTSKEDGLVTRTLTEYSNDRITSIGDYAFRGCSKLTSVNFSVATSIGKFAFYECTSLTSVNFPVATTTGMYTFYECSKLTSVNFPVTTTIGNNTFDSCTSLTSVNFPVTTTIGNNTFYGCTSLTSVDFPKVTEIRLYAFDGCTKLTSVILRNTSKVCTLNINAFINTPIESGTGYIYVPDDLVESYKTATNWSTYAAQIKPLSEYTGE